MVVISKRETASGPDDRASYGGRATLEVVAARAGVSRATASRVLRGSLNVSTEARDAVLRAADELSYTVNRAARALVTRRSDSVAFLVAENEDRIFSDPYFLGILRGAQSEVAAAGMQLVFIVASTPEEVKQFEEYAIGGHVDGVLLISLHGDHSLPQHLESIGVPTVLNGRSLSDDKTICYVDSDNTAGARAATELLIARGANRIATITGRMDMSAGVDRLLGYQDALIDSGRKPLKKHVALGDFTIEGGARAMRNLLRADPDIDAVFAASDLTALGAMRTLSEMGRTIPTDVALVGFDDVREASVVEPALTTVRQSMDELGHTMARTLLSRIAGEEVPQITVLPVEIVRRESA
jgi:DNA-binding LacI/PurR family transcriptional regulator